MEATININTLERYANAFFVFLLSAVLHLLLDKIAGIPVQFSGAMALFHHLHSGFMIEDGIQALYKRLEGSDTRSILIWKRAVGCIWVVLWPGIASTWFMHPNMQNTPPAMMNLILISFSDVIGPIPMAGFIAIGGLVVKFRLGVEV